LLNAGHLRRPQHQAGEERGAAPHERVKEGEIRPGLVGKGAAKAGNVTEKMGKEFVGLATITPRRHQIRWQRGLKVTLQRAQEWAGHFADALIVEKKRAGHRQHAQFV
jgi:hypothetical protein